MTIHMEVVRAARRLVCLVRKAHGDNPHWDTVPVGIKKLISILSGVEEKDAASNKLEKELWDDL
jgi:hypothetical protein